MTKNTPNLCQLTRNHIAWNFLFTFSSVPGGTAAMKGAVIIDVDDDVFQRDKVIANSLEKC